ncbi:MAG: SPOR domain-containing protein [Candidatus Omnitrophica bacterium]|nr:SPOR domain-containing protein [Candidatus Omnitrophota bacterium]
MNISYKERQITLFPDATPAPDESKRPHFTAAQLTLGVENLVILTIVSIMVILFSFSIGVERGKGIALREMGQPVSVDKISLVKEPAVPQAPAKPFWSMFGKGSVEATPLTDKDTEKMSPSDSKGADSLVGKAVVKVSEKASKVSKTPTKTATGFTIQIASYKTEKGAQIEASSLKKKGYNNVFFLQKGSYVILCVGNFQKKEEASLLGKKLMGRYQDLRVRSL